MKTIDAVNEFKGSYPYGESFYIIHWVNARAGALFSFSSMLNDCKPNSNWKYVCTKAEFNTLVQECRTNFGSSVTYDEYREPILALMRKLHADYVEQTGSCIAAIEFRDKAADTINKESNMKPVFTQEMSDNGELPPIGSECLAQVKGFDNWFKFRTDYIGVKHIIGTRFDERREACFGILNLKFKPIDTRTDKEKAIDDIYTDVYADKVIHDMVRDGHDDTLIERVLNVAYDEWVGK